MTPEPPGDLTILRACFYGLWLRHRGFAPDEAAALVSERYPSMRKRLRKIAASKELERHERADAAAGGAL